MPNERQLSKYSAVLKFTLKNASYTQVFNWMKTNQVVDVEIHTSGAYTITLHRQAKQHFTMQDILLKYPNLKNNAKFMEEFENN